MTGLRAPFPYFGGKSSITDLVWRRLGRPVQYIEPFCGSAAMLLAAPQTASLEVANDINGFIANFWRAVKHQPDAVARWADYPVSHIDLGARHTWLMDRRNSLGDGLRDAVWPGDAQAAGWWLWGQCSWIGSGWCEWADPARGRRGKGRAGGGEDAIDATSAGMGVQAAGKIPHASDAGMGVQAEGQIPHATSAGMGVQAEGQIPHATSAGMGVQAAGKIPHATSAGMGDLLTSGGVTAWDWLHRLAARLERVRLVHGAWDRCLNNHYGAESTAVFLDPPYRAFESLYGCAGVASAVEDWARQHGELRIALCGHAGDYSLDGWDAVRWDRKRLTYAGGKTTALECVWFSPGCLPDLAGPLFSRGAV